MPASVPSQPSHSRRTLHHATAGIAEQGGWSPTSRVLSEYMRVVDE
ncbi:hypothetical protein [Nonomuraea sp. NPDC005650]